MHDTLQYILHQMITPYLRRSPLIVDFEIIGASSQNPNTEENTDDFVIIQPVHDGKFSI